jgi:Asp-tRNA(Asn)/Glu-tRNA(Gln) amidotransferase A subunit family amidase
MEPWQMSAVELSHALHAGRLSAVEALDSVIARADAVGHAINPFSVDLRERAIRAARAADERLQAGDAGPLTGIPISAKDSQWLAGVESAHGSLTMRGFVPDRTAVVLERLEAAGAVIFAKTAVPEFCYTGVTESPVHGRTSNPWRLDRTSGGSSGGAGAAVAAGIGALSMGGDGGGSIRIPSAFCGIVGFKPTFGAVPREPAAEAWKTLVSVGPMARSVADIRLVMPAVAGHDPRDRYSIDVPQLDRALPAPGGLRLVVSEDLGAADVDDDVREVFRNTVETLRRAGVTIVEDGPGLPSSVETWAAIAAYEAYRAEHRVLREHPERLTTQARGFIEFGEWLGDERYHEALHRRREIHAAYAAMFERTGALALLTPTVGLEAFPHGSTYPATVGGRPVDPIWRDWGTMLYDANLCGFPAVALPVGLGGDGLPISLQVVGLNRTDGRTLAVAEAIEHIVGPFPRPPEPFRDGGGAAERLDAGLAGLASMPEVA